MTFSSDGNQVALEFLLAEAREAYDAADLGVRCQCTRERLSRPGVSGRALGGGGAGSQLFDQPLEHVAQVNGQMFVWTGSWAR